jgi:CRP-like cAMP-binding protein
MTTGGEAVATSMATARRNAVLRGLADDDLGKLLPALHERRLSPGQVLYKAGQPVDAVQFPTVGVVSIVAEVNPGEMVEAATVGREGMVGISVFLGAGAPTEHAVVQVPGHALTMSAEDFRHHVAIVDGPLQTMLRRYTQALFTQLARNAACNRVHPVRQRAARWLLMTADRMDAPRFELTQEFLAQMLAVRRASVSEVAQALAEDGCITYTRGVITILDRQRLQANACDCYDVIRRTTSEALSAR